MTEFSVFFEQEIPMVAKLFPKGDEKYLFLYN